MSIVHGFYSELAESSGVQTYIVKLMDGSEGHVNYFHHTEKLNKNDCEWDDIVYIGVVLKRISTHQSIFGHTVKY